MPAARISTTCACGLVAMTSASHAEGREFDPGQVYLQRLLHYSRRMLVEDSATEMLTPIYVRGGDLRARSRRRADTEGPSGGQSLVQRGARGSCMFMTLTDAYTCTCVQIWLRVQFSIEAHIARARESAPPSPQITSSLRSNPNRNSCWRQCMRHGWGSRFPVALL